MKKSLLIPLTVLLLCCAVVGVVYAQSPEPAGGATSAETTVANEVLAVAKLITYQGRLLNPTTRVPKADDTYPTVFKLYNHATSTSAANVVWSETQNVVTQDGYFTVLLGSVSAFAPTVFNGQNLWLGVAVGSDAEATPRTRITAVAYALYAEQANTATSATTANNANLLDGLDSTAFTASGEVVNIVKASDGAGSGIDADLLDGVSSSGFAKRTQFTGGTDTLTCDGINFFQTFPIPVDELHFWRLDNITTGGRLSVSVNARVSGGSVVYDGSIINPDDAPGSGGCTNAQWQYRIVEFVFSN